MTIKLNRNGYELNYNTETELLTGETYPVKAWIASYLEGKWNAAAKAWVVAPRAMNFTGAKEAIEYAKVKAARETATAAPKAKEVLRKQMVNGSDGFYFLTYYTDGTSSRDFAG